MVARVTRLVAEKFVLSTFPRALTTLSSMCSRAVRALESSPGLIMMMDNLNASVSGPAYAGKVEFMSLGHCDGVFVVSETESDLFSVTGFGK